MAVCKYCGSKGLFLGFDANNVCNKCRDTINNEIKQIQFDLDNNFMNAVYSHSYEICKSAIHNGLACLQLLRKYISFGYKSLIISSDLIDYAEEKLNEKAVWLENIEKSISYPEEKYYHFAIGQLEEFLQKENFNKIHSLVPERHPLFYAQSPMNLVDTIASELHFLYQNCLNNIYKNKHLTTNPVIQQHFEDLCKRDISLFFGTLHFVGHVDSFYKLTLFYEKIGKIEKALEIADLGESFKIQVHHDTEYFKKKKEKLLKKLNKNNH